MSQYAHLATVDVVAGADVGRGQIIGTVGRDPDATFPAHLHFELRSDPALSPTFWPSANGWDDADVAGAYLPPREFIARRRALFVPQQEDLVVLLDQDSDSMALASRGAITERYQVGWGQARGAKRERGDLKTPRGMHFITSRARGEFPGEYGAFYGGHWIKVNYPGPRDAARGLADLGPAGAGPRLPVRLPGPRCSFARCSSSPSSAASSCSSSSR